MSRRRRSRSFDPLPLRKAQGPVAQDDSSFIYQLLQKDACRLLTESYASILPESSLVGLGALRLGFGLGLGSSGVGIGAIDGSQ